MAIVEKIAIKAPSGFSYKELKDVTINDSKLGIMLGSLSKRIEDLNKEIESVHENTEHLNTSFTSINKRMEGINLSLNNINDAIKNIKVDVNNNKQDNVLLAYQSFKVDLLLGLLPESVKQEFDSMNINGSRLEELQRIMFRANLSRKSEIPNEILIYMGGTI